MKKGLLYTTLFLAAGAFLLLSAPSCGNKKGGQMNPINDTLSTLRNLDLLIGEDPDNPENYFARAQYHFDAGNPASAIVDCQKAIRLDSTKAKYYLLLGDLNMMVRKPDETRVCLEKALELEPENTEALLKFGELQLYLKDYEQMFSYVNRALKKEPYNSKGYFLKGLAYAEMRDTNTAITSLQTCVEIDPEYFNAYMLLGTIFSDRNNPLAATYFQNAIQTNPGKGEAYYGLAYYYQMNNQPEAAIATYRNMLRVSSQNPAAMHNIGYIYLFDLNMKDSAISWFNDAIRADVRYADAIYHRGYAYELKGDKTAARMDYEAALRVKEDHEMAEKGLNRVGRSKN